MNLNVKIGLIPVYCIFRCLHLRIVCVGADLDRSFGHQVVSVFQQVFHHSFKLYKCHYPFFGLDQHFQSSSVVVMFEGLTSPFNFFTRLFPSTIILILFQFDLSTNLICIFTASFYPSYLPK